MSIVKEYKYNRDNIPGILEINSILSIYINSIEEKSLSCTLFNLNFILTNENKLCFQYKNNIYALSLINFNLTFKIDIINKEEIYELYANTNEILILNLNCEYLRSNKNIFSIVFTYSAINVIKFLMSLNYEIDGNIFINYIINDGTDSEKIELLLLNLVIDDGVKSQALSYVIENDNVELVITIKGYISRDFYYKNLDKYNRILEREKEYITNYDKIKELLI